MAKDFLNGLSVVKLDSNTATQWIASATGSPAEHPWRKLFRKRVEPPTTVSTTHHETYAAPHYYRIKVREPRLEYRDNQFSTRGRGRGRGRGRFGAAVPTRASTAYAHETIRLCDVMAFRAATAKKVPRTDVNQNEVSVLRAGLARLSTTSTRPVIYRYIEVIKNSTALLEAIHFDLFMPDRMDLRFLGVPLSSIPSGTLEGDYFRVPDADLLSNPSFAVELDKYTYPVVWEAKKIQKMIFDEKAMKKKENVLTYVLKRSANVPDAEMVVSDVSDSAFPVRHKFFPDNDSRREHSLIRVTSMDMGTAHLYAVEPPLPGPKPPPKKNPAENGDAGTVEKKNKKKKKSKKSKKKDEGDKGKEKEEEPPFDPSSEYLKRVYDVRTSSQRSGRVVCSARALTATEAERIEDRLGGFTTYGQPGDLELMDELFRMGSRYRENASLGVDAKEAGEIRIDESVVLKTLMDEEIGPLALSRPLLDCMYSSTARESHRVVPTDLVTIGDIRLNAAQSRALRLYADDNGPRVFCILSPPGSGKTTVAAAMAAEVGRKTKKVGTSKINRQERDSSENTEEYRSVQLLLSVQNVAVDNMGAALKKMDYREPTKNFRFPYNRKTAMKTNPSGTGEVYNMKSSKRLNFNDPAAFDFFDLMSKSELDKWKKGLITRPPLDEKEKKKKKNTRGKKMSKAEMKKKVTEELITYHRREYEKTVCPKILLATVEMVLQKMYTGSKLCNDLKKVNRIIIDEASLLTEAALYAIIRRFPKARIVLIGDDHQLPPFMYDEKILGHELAGRPALTVAMKTGRVPVVELNKVYRAPPSLVAPYNRLAYGGRLVSKKPEGMYPLSKRRLIHSGIPQLLLIDVDGKQERNEKTMSLYNEKEIDAVKRLLRKFPKGWKKDIMIICLYKEQKNRLQTAIGDDYTVLTVDSAQGKEKSIVILMTTRTEIPKAGTFFDSTERCNVAVSRQQNALIILGKASFLTTNKPWSTVVNGDDFTLIKTKDIK